MLALCESSLKHTVDKQLNLTTYDYHERVCLISLVSHFRVGQYHNSSGATFNFEELLNESRVEFEEWRLLEHFIINHAFF
jgi:hypothetical protein